MLLTVRQYSFGKNKVASLNAELEASQMLNYPSPQLCIPPIISQQFWLDEGWWWWSAGVMCLDNRPWAIQPSTPVSTALKVECGSLTASGWNCTSSRASVGICCSNKEITNSALCRIITVHSVKGQEMIPNTEGPNNKSRASEQKPSVSPCVPAVCCHQPTLMPTALLGS